MHHILKFQDVYYGPQFDSPGRGFSLFPSFSPSKAQDRTSNRKMAVFFRTLSQSAFTMRAAVRRYAICRIESVVTQAATKSTDSMHW
jgi:hypothetical protein